MFRCDLKNKTQNGMCLKEIALRAQNVTIILGSLVTIVKRSLWPFNEHENIHIDNQQYIHMRFENYKEGDYNLNLDLPIVSY